MKKGIAIVFLGLMFTLIVAACKTKKHANCEAYGGKKSSCVHFEVNPFILS